MKIRLAVALAILIVCSGPFSGSPVLATGIPPVNTHCEFEGETTFTIDTSGRASPGDATFTISRDPLLWSWYWLFAYTRLLWNGSYDMFNPVYNSDNLPWWDSDSWVNGALASPAGDEWYDHPEFLEFDAAEFFDQFVVQPVTANGDGADLWVVGDVFEITFGVSNSDLGPSGGEVAVVNDTICYHTITFTIVPVPPPPEVSYCGFSNNNRGSLEELIACKTPSELPGTI